jgi:hypothetical protein
MPCGRAMNDCKMTNPLIGRPGDKSSDRAVVYVFQFDYCAAKT